MAKAQRVESDVYMEIDYRQFEQGKILVLVRTIAGWLTWPLVLPLAGLSRWSDFVFRTASEFFALVPFLFGVIIRYEFYRFALTSCGRNVVIGFGAVFYYRDVEIGDNVAIGNYTVVHHCDFGSFVVVADGCYFLSGSRYHNIDRVDVPIATQGGKLRRISIADDCWVGAGAIVMSDVQRGCVVGAGSVVTREVEPYSIVVGNPAKVLRKRS